MTTLKQAVEVMTALARGEPVDSTLAKRVGAALAAHLDSLQEPNAPVERLVLPRPSQPRRKRVTVYDHQPIVARHCQALIEAGVAEDAFESTLSALLADPAVTVKVLRQIAADYTGTPVTSRTTRAEAERLIRQAFARHQWQHEAYRRIDNLNAAK